MAAKIMVSKKISDQDFGAIEWTESKSKTSENPRFSDFFLIGSRGQHLPKLNLELDFCS